MHIILRDMPRMAKSPPADTRLGFCWYEPPDDKERLRDERWGHLIGAAHAVSFAIDELRRRTKDRDLSSALEQVAYHLENYLTRAYELRERLLALLAELSGKRDLVKKLKKSKTRKEAARQLAEFVKPEAVAVASKVLDAMEDDVLLRNLHTHQTTARLGIFVNGDMYDPRDAVEFMRGTDQEKRALRRFFRREIRKTVAQYDVRASTVVDLTMQVLELLNRDRLYGPR